MIKLHSIVWIKREFQSGNTSQEVGQVIALQVNKDLVTDAGNPFIDHIVKFSDGSTLPYALWELDAALF